VGTGQHSALETSLEELGSELGTALAAARGNDGAAGTGVHAGTEAVLACTTAVIRLESPLRHGGVLLAIYAAASGAHRMMRCVRLPGKRQPFSKHVSEMLLQRTRWWHTLSALTRQHGRPGARR